MEAKQLPVVIFTADVIENVVRKVIYAGPRLRNCGKRTRARSRPRHGECQVEALATLLIWGNQNYNKRKLNERYHNKTTY